MKNITLAIDETLLAKGRELAAARKTTLNAMVRGLLAHEVEQDGRLVQAKRELRELSEQADVTLEPGYRFKREDAYAERGVPRHERAGLRSDGTKERARKVGGRT
jgi:hypothetical protein